MTFKVPNLHNRIQLHERGHHVRASLTLPSGRVVSCVVNCESPEKLSGELERIANDGATELGAEEYDELGGFLSKLKKAAKKVGKVALKPLQVAHQITHKGPLGKLEKKVQDAVGKALPFTKPFIRVHNSLASPVHKAIETGSIKKALTAKAIAQVTKDLPAATRGATQAALVARVKETEALKSIGKAAAKAKVIAAAKTAAKRGDKEAAALLKRAKQGTTGTYTVKTPSGRTIAVPAAKIAHT